MSWFASKDKLRLSTGVLDIELVLDTWPRGDKSRGSISGMLFFDTDYSWGVLKLTGQLI
jgi:hypothetical protein